MERDGGSWLLANHTFTPNVNDKNRVTFATAFISLAIKIMSHAKIKSFETKSREEWFLQTEMKMFIAFGIPTAKQMRQMFGWMSFE